MNVLVTGGAGFIGSNFIHYMLEEYRNYKIVNYDVLTYAGNLDNLKGVQEHPNYTFIQGNITNRELVEYIVEQYDINIIINFAAESHVDRSIIKPDVFVQSNVLGTQVLLNVAKKKNVSKYIQISTDEVYGTLGEKGYFSEETPISPNSPYSASKAAADMIVQSYFKTYGMDVNITRCSNNYGPYQFPEKLIPLMIINALQGKVLPIYGDGQNIRDWLHVNDHCAAIDLIIHKGRPGEVYNIGGNNERTNNEIVELIVQKLGVSKELIKYVDDRLGHDRRYAIDSSKLTKEIGWSPKYTFNQGIDETIHWYVKNKAWWSSLNRHTY